MPEGDTIFLAARTLHRALAGEVVTRFETLCGAAVRSAPQGPDARRTYWCPRCQPDDGAGAGGDR